MYRRAPIRSTSERSGKGAPERVDRVERRIWNQGVEGDRATGPEARARLLEGKQILDLRCAIRAGVTAGMSLPTMTTGPGKIRLKATTMRSPRSPDPCAIRPVAGALYRVLDARLSGVRASSSRQRRSAAKRRTSLAVWLR